MHIDRIDLNLFLVLEAIYSERSVTRASQKLHLSQPAVSHALSRLRSLFGDPLFVREGRTMVPTPLTRNLIGPVRNSLRGLEITLNEVESFDPTTTARRFTLGVRDVLESTLLPALMPCVQASAPAVEIAAVRVDRREMEAELAAGTLDAAIDVWLPLSENVRHERIAADRYVVVARNGHPAVGPNLDLDTYLAQDHVLVSSRRTGPGLEDAELSRLGLERRIRLRCQHYFAACRVVSQTDCILTMPENYAQVANTGFDNWLVSLPLNMPPLDSFLYWHSNVETEPANCWLREQLLATMRSQL